MTAPKRVAVLGGGVSAMTTAFELTRPELAGQYDVTVYQMGWRLGGKGASGRNREIANRIEEHGLHIWMGFYENAFKVMQDAYGELNRTVGPLQTWEDAFKKHSYIVLGEPLATKEDFWQLVFPTNEGVPGVDPEEPTIWELAAYILIWIYNHWQSSSASQNSPPLGAPPIPPWIEALARESESRGGLRTPPPHGVIGALAGSPPPSIDAADAHDSGSGRLARAIAIARASAKDGQTPPQNVIDAIIKLIQDAMAFVKSILGTSIQTDFGCFQIWVGVNLAGSSVIGILKDDVITKGWDSVDGLDLRAWLGNHGADADTTLASGPIRGIYDLAFCYVDGDIKNPQFAAGTAMRGMLKMAFAYKGAIFYKMQAGMGDTVFTPLYRVLKNRGVKFKFFHKVTDINVDASNAVASIDFIEQAQLTGGDYEPLLDVLGLGCWPSEPLFEQIQFGQDLKDSGINFESSWAPAWQYSQPKTIHAGTDFDLVVYGISVGALPQSAGSLLTPTSPLLSTYTNVKTVQTCAFQLWLKPDLTGLGWVDPPTTTERPVLGGFVEPLDTWSDMSQLLVRETWPEGTTPLNVAYFCGVFDQASTIPPYSDTGFPAKELARLDAMALPFLNKDVGTLWPSTVTGGGGFNWDLLVDLNPDAGAARFLSQFRRVNIDPTERYVLSVPKSTSFRLPPNGTGIGNFFITGDWIQCGLNAGCVEAAVTAGKLTARAITGATTPIHGECDRLLAPRPR